MRLIILAAILVSIVGALASAYLVAKKIKTPSKAEIAKRKHCELITKTEAAEKEMYGHVVSRSVESHIRDCPNHNPYRRIT